MVSLRGFLNSLLIPQQVCLTRCVISQGQLASLFRIKINIGSFHCNDLPTVSLYDEHIIQPNTFGVLNSLIAGNDSIVFIQ